MDVTIPVGGGVLAAGDSGGDGPPVVLVHAGWTDRSSWARVTEQLAGRYRIICYDTRGFGASPPPHTPYTQLGDLLTVLDHFGLPRAALVGHSGGGGTALGLALAQPDRVSSLALLAPGVPDYPWPADDPYNAEFMALATKDDRAGLAELGLRTWAAAGPDAAARAQIESAVAGMFAQGDFEQPDPPAYDRLAEISAPAVVMLGDLEYPMVVRCADSVADRIPGCRRVRVPGADHLIPLRAPGLVAQVITEQAG
ncbi:MAG: alpha/beta fold hydrolase [Streptosporangiaceae bacterium]